MQPDLTQLLNDKYSNINSNWNQICSFFPTRFQRNENLWFQIRNDKENKFSISSAGFALENWEMAIHKTPEESICGLD